MPLSNDTLSWNNHTKAAMIGRVLSPSVIPDVRYQTEEGSRIAAKRKLHSIVMYSVSKMKTDFRERLAPPRAHPSSPVFEEVDTKMCNCMSDLPAWHWNRIQPERTAEDQLKILDGL